MKELFKAMAKEMNKSMNNVKVSESNKAQFNKEAERFKKNLAMLNSKLNKYCYLIAMTLNMMYI